LGVDPRRNAAAIVLDADRTVGVQRDEDPVAMAGQRLVDGIVRNLEHHVMQTRPVVGIADVHAGTLAHRVEALEDLDAVGAIFTLVRIGCHSSFDRGKSRKSLTDSRARVRARERNAPPRWFGTAQY